MGTVWTRTRPARLAAAVVGVVASLGGCWPAPGGGSNRNGYNGVETVVGLDSAPDLTEVWQASVSWTTPPPVVFGQLVYAVVGADVVAREVTTGETVWSSPLFDVQAFDLFVHDGALLDVEGGGPMSDPSSLRRDLTTGVIVGGYEPPVQTIRGTVGASIDLPWRYARDFVLTVTDPVGLPAWSTPVLVDPVGPAPRPTATRERVVVSGKGLVSTDPSSTATALGLRAYALDGSPSACATDSDGEYPVTYGCPVWAVAVEGTSMSAPVVSDDLTTVVVGTDAGLVYAISEATGSMLWTANVGSAVTADPGIAGGTVLVPTAADGLVALPLAGCGAPSCAPIWTSASPAGVAQQPVAAGGAVFVGHDGGVLAAYPVGGCGSATCEPAWSTPLGGSFDVPMAIGSGHLFVTVDSVMHAFTPG
jgi:outer membrane protein assembly factor BamB